MNLTEQQKKVIDYDNGCCVVKACPGSGKTASVALRIDKLIRTKPQQLNRTGIAAMSFTNAAADEIKAKLQLHNGLNFSLEHPHFMGTIDKFVNTYIFLPFGHLIMQCGKRPELVGKPFRNWTKGKGERFYKTNPKTGLKDLVDANPHEYFDVCSLTISDVLYRMTTAQEFPFSFKEDKYYNNDGRVHKKVQDVIDAKWENFKLGFANQSDANYIALKVLAKFPLIAKAVANKFQYFIVDEAQDTNAIQIRIIEILKESGAKNIMLIGDRDQSIYEWNHADPELFDKKYNEWDKIDLYENFRSSQNICDFSKPFSSFGRSYAKSEVAKYSYKPSIAGYVAKEIKELEPILRNFCATCEENNITINPEKVAVLYRGTSMGEIIEPLKVKEDYHSLPWTKANYYVKDIVLGKLTIEKGNLTSGYRVIEKAYFDALFKPHDKNYHCDSSQVAKYIEADGLQKHRDQLFRFINVLPDVKGSILKDWIAASNAAIKAAGISIDLKINNANGNHPVEQYLIPTEISKHHPFYFGTIHSVKGKTFEAVLLLLDKKTAGGTHYKTLLTKKIRKDQEEELRNVYVGITRPRKVLMLAVPEDDVAVWQSKVTG